MIGALARSLFGTENDRKIKPLLKRAEIIGELEEKYQALSDAELRDQTEILKGRLAEGETLNDVLNDAFAVVREGAKRALGQRHYDVQLVGGMILHSGKISEMKTGEGKTLVATLAVYLNALSGKGVHVVTVNDYLAKRDAEWMGQVYRFLGLSVGVILHGLSDEERKAAYNCDVTYATNNELGFDYLRDNMKFSLEAMVQRGHNFAIVDEVDSILVDEARTPLIISGPTEDQSELYRTLDTFIPQLTEEHYELDEKTRQVHLTEEGNEFIEQLLSEADMLQGESLYDTENVTIVHHVNQALKAHMVFQKDKDYIVKGGKVVIIDEFTGRMMEGRRYSEGLHQALEAKEKVAIMPENVTLASITFQNYFRLYDKLAGMTGTALTEASEFMDIYKLDVVEVPTNLPIQRSDADDEVYRTIDEKYGAIVALIAECHTRGQPVLVGTTSIEKSELLSGFLNDTKYLKKLGERLQEDVEPRLEDARTLAKKAENIKDEKKRAVALERAEKAMKAAQDYQTQVSLMTGAKGKKNAAIPHQVLNARFHEQEAQIVAQAGRAGAVTIATNMAGRGTDIQLGGNLEMRIQSELGDEATKDSHKDEFDRITKEIAEEKQKVLDAGGLYVVGTERHESRRIDNQLRGRSGRQGDPGASKFFVSIQDDLMRIFMSDRMDGMLKTLGLQEGEAIMHPLLNRALENAQKKVEARNFDIRKNVLKYDDVQNDQRKVMFEQRRDIMHAEDLAETITDMRHEVVEEMVARYIPERAYAEQWDTEGLQEEADYILGLKMPVVDWAKEEGIANEEMRERIVEKADAKAAERAVSVGPDIMRRVEKSVLLQTLDSNWRDHIVQLDHLRQVVGLRGYGQRDPLNEFKTEAFSLFENLLQRLRQDVTRTLLNIQFEVQGQPEPIENQALPEMEAHHVDPLTGQDDMAPPTPPPQARNRPAPGVPINPKDPSTWGKVPRNALCPCGSGKKYKHCHGAVVASA